jgi:hypothetical protein
MSKYHDDSAMGYASPDRNDLPQVRFSSTGTEVVNSPSNIYAWEASHPSKGTTTTVVTRQDDAWQKVLSPHLAATDRRSLQRVG